MNLCCFHSQNHHLGKNDYFHENNKHLLQTILFQMRYPDNDISKISTLSLCGHLLQIQIAKNKDVTVVHFLDDYIKALLHLMKNSRTDVVRNSLLTLNIITIYYNNSAYDSNNIQKVILTMLTKDYSNYNHEEINASTKYMFRNKLVQLTTNTIVNILEKHFSVEESLMNCINDIYEYEYQYLDVYTIRSGVHLYAKLSTNNEHMLKLNILVDILKRNIEDEEVNDCLMFAFGNLSQSHSYQRELVKLGLVKLVINIISKNKRSKINAICTLSNLSKNFENQLDICEDGGIQTLLHSGKIDWNQHCVQFESNRGATRLLDEAIRYLSKKNKTIDMSGNRGRDKTTTVQNMSVKS
jgi:hypothetical protein